MELSHMKSNTELTVLRLTGLTASWNKSLNVLQRFTAEPRVYIILYLHNVNTKITEYWRNQETMAYSQKGNKKMSAARYSRHWNYQIKKKLESRYYNYASWDKRKVICSKWNDKKYKTVKGYLFSLKFHTFPNLLVYICSLCSFIKPLIFCCVWNYFSFTFRIYLHALIYFILFAAIWLN